MKKLIILFMPVLTAVCGVCFASETQIDSSSPPSVRPHGDIRWFRDAGFGMFIHWGIYSVPARHEWVQAAETIPHEKYRKYLDAFNPDLFNPVEWAQAAKRAGMKYVVFTAKHHDGFCMFDSKYTDYKCTNTPAKCDILRRVIDAFRDAGLRIGIYYSLIDWHHPQYVVDDCFGPYSRIGKDKLAEMNSDRNMHLYAQYVRNQITELLTDYGKIDELWFDYCYGNPEDILHGKGPEHFESVQLLKLARSLQPDIIINDRAGIPEDADIATPEQYTPDQGMVDRHGKPVAWENCQTFSGSWGYHRDEMTWKSPEQCVKMLIDVVSRGGNLLMNVGPTARGYFDHRAMACLNAYADWMKYCSASIYGCGHAPRLVAPDNCRYTYNSRTKKLYLHIYSWPSGHITVKKMAGKITFVRFLHDGSEIRIQEYKNRTLQQNADADDVVFELPVQKPPVLVPVIEISLKDQL